jgi:hypothetical protein
MKIFFYTWWIKKALLHTVEELGGKCRYFSDFGAWYFGLKTKMK